MRPPSGRTDESLPGSLPSYWPMRFFRPEVEIVLKTIGLVALIGLIAIPAGWGYEQRQQVRTWRRTACAYRLRELAHEMPFLATLDEGRDSCAMLQRLGLGLDPRP